MSTVLLRETQQCAHVQQRASVFVRAVGRCTALHEPPRVELGFTAQVVRPVTATRRVRRAARAIEVPDGKL